jgi:cytosine/adenosine deaminase-related metal-dependent hydrolase
MLIRARYILPLNRPPLENGVVALEGDRIAWVGRSGDLPRHLAGSAQLDLGEVILLPGLINAHCHLDYTDLAGVIPPPKGFSLWLQAMVASKLGWSLKQYKASWSRGADMLLRTGCTTVADTESVPELLPEVWGITPLRVISFLELLQVRRRQAAPEIVERAVNDLLGLENAHGRVGLSPHAPYTTSPDLLEFAARAAHRRRWRLSTHVAESEEEFEMFMYAQGPMFNWLRSQREVSDCGQGSPVQHLERYGYLDENLIAIHVNYLCGHDAGLLGRNGVHVVHCPRSHEYFQHLKFPRTELEQAGVNICLGTDSLATVRSDPKLPPLELSLFKEMQTMASRTPDLAPAAILRMTTVNPALALGKKGLIGELAQNAMADLITIPFSGGPSDLFEHVVHHQGPVSATMIGGAWAIEP